MNFPAAFAALLGNEGGYSNNPADPGGETMWGVTKRVAQAHGYTGAMKDLPLATAQAIAKSEYWDKFHCDDLDARIAFQVFDTAYNGGHPVAWLQAAAGVTADGVFGPATLSAVKASDPLAIIMRFDAARLDYMADCKDAAAFARGWMHRIAHNLRLAAE